MRAFEVCVNNNKMCVAGIGEDGVLTAIVGLATGKGPMELHLHVGGLVSPSQEHVTWVKSTPLHLGDKIHIHLVKAPTVDDPKTREQTDPAKDLQARKDYVRAMAKHLGWKIQASPRKSSSRKRR